MITLPAAPFDLTQIWGNGWPAAAGIYVRARSACSMWVFDTDALSVDIDYDVLIGAAVAKYMAIAIYRSAVGATKPATFVGYVDPGTSPIEEYRSGPVTLGGSGMRRIWIVAGGWSNQVQCTPRGFWLPTGSTVTRVVETGPSVGVEGWGSLNTASDLGYYSIAGVLQGGAYATARAQHVARLTQMAPSVIVGVTACTNRVTQAPATSDLQVEVDAMLADWQTLVPAAQILWMTTLRRNPDAQGAYRIAEAAASAGRGVTTLDGLSLGAQAFSNADLSADNLHPNDGGHVKIANALSTWLTSQGLATQRVALVGNSIVNGYGAYISDASQIYAARDGCAQVLRGLR